MKLFVYGTLQKGHWNNHLLAGATFIGKALTRKPYLLWHNGFPIATHNEEIASHVEERMFPISGQVFEVDENQLARCDRLEGHPNWYKRTTISVDLEGQEEECFIYEMNQYMGREVCSKVVEEGNIYYRWAG